MIDISGFITRRTPIQRKSWIKLKNVGSSLVPRDRTSLWLHVNIVNSGWNIGTTHSREWNVGSKINSPTYSVKLGKPGMLKKCQVREVTWNATYRRLNLLFDRVLTWKGRDPMYSDEHAFSINIVRSSVTSNSSQKWRLDLEFTSSDTTILAEIWKVVLC